MEPRELKTLLLLEAIAKEEFQSQRDLSKKLKISLGLVNSVIKNLTAQGICKIVNGPKSKVKYLLTSLGEAEKTKLTKQFIAHSIDYYKTIKQRVSDILSGLLEAGKTKIVLYGTGEITEIACILLDNYNLDKVMIIDDQKANQKICGVKVNMENEMLYFDYDAVLINDSENTDHTIKHLINKGVPEDKIITIFKVGTRTDL